MSPALIGAGAEVICLSSARIGSATVEVTVFDRPPAGSDTASPVVSKRSAKELPSSAGVWLASSFTTSALNSMTTDSTAPVVSRFVSVPSLKKTSVPLA